MMLSHFQGNIELTKALKTEKHLNFLIPITTIAGGGNRRDERKNFL